MVCHFVVLCESSVFLVDMFASCLSLGLKHETLFNHVMQNQKFIMLTCCQWNYRSPSW